MSKYKLSTCPFCGKKNRLKVTHQKVLVMSFDDKVLYEGVITCENCELTLKSTYAYDDPQDAEMVVVEKWNSRK